MKKKSYEVTNIRLPKDDLLEYRRLALAEDKSFASWVRDILRAYRKSRKDARHG